MRPKIVFYLLVVIECFFLVMVIAPGVSRPKQMLRAEVQYAQTPNEEAKQAVESLKASRKARQAWLLAGVAGVFAVMVIYGWKNKARI